jgi:hypothetical protein
MEFGIGSAECGMKKNGRWEAMEFGIGNAECGKLKLKA